MLYKRKIEHFDAEGLETFLQNIKQYAILYREFPYFNDKSLMSFEDYEKRLFHILSVAEINTVIPLMLLIKYHYNGTQTYQECLYVIEIFIFTRWICGESTKGYNLLFADIITRFNKERPVEFLKDRLKDIPNKKKIQEVLMPSKHPPKKDKIAKMAKLILFWIELYRRNHHHNTQDITELTCQYSLEHLMPQSWEQYWGDVIKDKKKAEILIAHIGNMTLVKNGLNNTLKNTSWQIKLNGGGSKKSHLKACADLLITREVLGVEQWNEDSIKARSKQLMKEFFEIWDISRLDSVTKTQEISPFWL